VPIEGRVTISQALPALRDARNGVPGELLVRLAPERVIALAEIDRRLTGARRLRLSGR